ncbi:MAG: hypothetical protein BA863_10425 [Desulfovibrio sp. S3730MH75]|nr:MAG: hypothetical protein BA863_10425 [Desulfovibrio sp. S3730MH75]
MKCLLIGFMLIVVGCADEFMADSDFESRTSKFEELASCQEAFHKLEASCDVVDSGIDLEIESPSSRVLHDCLWAMGHVYGDRFPIGEHVETTETRPGFFFECLRKYSDVSEDYCLYKLNECEEDLRGEERAVSRVRKACEEYCGNRTYCDCW